MRTSILAAATGSVAMIMATAAGAADLPRAAPAYKTPAPIVTENWSGFYIGGSLGVRWADAQETTVSIAGAPPPGVVPPSANYDHAAFRAGVYGGFNWQVSPLWVIGIEGDWAWADGNKSNTGLPGAGVLNPGDATGFNQRWDASVRARIGYLVAPTALLYITGGAAWQNFDATAVCSAATCGTALAQTVSKTLSGWTIGGGLEGMLSPRWLMRVEYRYSDYNDVTLAYFSGGNATVINGDLSTHTVYVGLAYKFGGPYGTVVSRY